jgi:hypothetical protein
LRGKTALGIALLAAAAVAALAAQGGARLTWENAGVRLQHPPHQAAAALGVAAALAGAALSARPGRLAAALLAAAAVALASQGVRRLVWRVDAVQAGLHERTLSGWTRIDWREVERVQPGPDRIRLRARSGAEIAIATGEMEAEDRTRLERTIARRVREANP